jgi:predicted nucleic acid-binding protein
MIAFDAGVLIAYHNPRCDEEIRIRVESLIRRAEKSKKRIVLPAPAVAEYLAGIKLPSALARASGLINASRSFRVAEFGQKATIETALVIAKIKNAASRKHEGKSWAKAKFDWQIAAIAKVEGAETIYTTDDDVVRAAKHFGIQGVRIETMDLPPEARQRGLALPEPASGEGGW